VAKTVTFDVLAVAKGVGFDELGNNIKQMADTSKVHVSNLVTAIAAIGPAAIPAAAVTIGAFAGLIPLAGAAAFAFLGITSEMKKGTPVGLEYKAALKPLIDEFDRLKQITASNLLGGFSAAIAKSKEDFPALNKLMATAATQLGKIVAALLPAMLSLLIQLSPLFKTFGDLAVKAATAFGNWAQHSPAIKNFVQYVQQNLPAVGAILKGVATAVGNIVFGLVPMGGLVLKSIAYLATWTGKIPVKILQDLGPAIAAIVVGVKAWSIWQAVLDTTLGGFVTGTVVALSAALVLLWKSSNTARLRIMGDLVDIGQAFVDTFTVIYDGFFRPIIRTFEGILGALGHLPGALGKPFRAAKDALKGFDSDVQNMVNQANDHLSKLRASVQTQQAKQQLNDLLAYIEKHSQQTINIDLQARTNYGKVPFAPNTGQNFYGGQYQGTHATGGMLGEGWSIINEEGPEWMYKSGSQVQVYPHGTGGPKSGPSVVNNFYITSFGGQGAGRTIAAELSRFLGKDVIAVLRAG
jgi:hypothetical protein